MKRFLTILLICFSFVAINAQQQSNVLLGTNSQLSSTDLSELTLSPTVMYGVTNDIFAGGSIDGDSDNLNYSVQVRGYVTELGSNRVFGQINYDDDVSLSVGLTGFINDWFFVEPSFNYTFNESRDYNLGIGFGLRL